jgi:tetratricopeptide (TPR) repeat protein
MMTRITPNPHAKAARSVCLSEAGREGDARRFLDEALIEAPKDPLLLFVQAVLLERVARRSEAMALLRLPELSDLPSVWALTGQICLDTGDMSCAQTNFQKIYDRDDKDLRALAGLATVAMKSQRIPDAMSLARKGLDLDPSYLPLIELRELKETSQ